MNSEVNALKINENDNVVVALETLKDENFVSVQGSLEKFKVSGTIPYGHKVALVSIAKGDKIIKYGECMGVATADIQRGDHVHEFNVRGLHEDHTDNQISSGKGVGYENV